ncbi:MAG TPA: hypothetical protein VLW50_14025 [Streptosporangiaceae bacterium]|nr:hypothetical protein [Streptosporangiaceae bacterium]
MKPYVRVDSGVGAECVPGLELRQVPRAYVALCATCHHEVGTVIAGSADAAANDLRVIEQFLQDAWVCVELTDLGTAAQH